MAMDRLGLSEEPGACSCLSRAALQFCTSLASVARNEMSQWGFLVLKSRALCSSCNTHTGVHALICSGAELLSSCVAVELHHVGQPLCIVVQRIFFFFTSVVIFAAVPRYSPHPRLSAWISKRRRDPRWALWRSALNGNTQVVLGVFPTSCLLGSQAAPTLNQGYFKIIFELRSVEILTCVSV